MSRNEPCICGSGKKQKRCHPDILPESRAGKVLRMYSEIDQLVEIFYVQGEKEKPPCQSGCNKCCYHNFVISAIEFKVIAMELKKWTNERLEDLYNVTAKQLEYLQVNHPEIWSNLEKDTTNNNSIIQQQMRMAHDSYGLPCPLLNVETGTCSVYNVRPLICRMHGSTHFSQDEYEVCEKIPSNIENVVKTPDASRFSEELFWLSNFMVDGRVYNKLSPYNCVKTESLLKNEESHFKNPRLE